MATTVTFSASSFGALPAVRCQRRRTGTDSVPARPCLGDYREVSGLQRESEPSGEWPIRDHAGDCWPGL